MRDTVRAFVDDKLKPIIEECHREGRTPLELVPEMGALNLFGASLTEYGLPGLGGVAYGLIMQELERGDSGLRSFVSVQSSLVMYPIYTFGSKEQKDRWIPRSRLRRGHRLLRPHRARLRLQPRRHAHHGQEGGQRLGAQRLQAVDHQRHPRRRGRGLGQDRRRRPRLPGREGHPGLHLLGPARQVLPAGLHHLRARLPRLPHPGGEHAARHHGPQKRPHVPQPGALRHRLGRRRLGHGDLLHGSRPTPRSGSSSAASPSPATSSCRRSSPGWPPRSARPSSSPSSSAGSRTTAASSTGRSPWASATTSGSPASAPGSPARSWAPTASWTTTRSSATCSTSSRSTPTRAPTTSTA